jgi:hypothetical protein
MSIACCKHWTPMLQTRQIHADYQWLEKSMVPFARALPILQTGTLALRVLACQPLGEIHARTLHQPV